MYRVQLNLMFTLFCHDIFCGKNTSICFLSVVFINNVDYKKLYAFLVVFWALGIDIVSIDHIMSKNLASAIIHILKTIAI